MPTPPNSALTAKSKVLAIMKPTIIQTIGLIAGYILVYHRIGELHNSSLHHPGAGKLKIQGSSVSGFLGINVAGLPRGRGGTHCQFNATTAPNGTGPSDGNEQVRALHTALTTSPPGHLHWPMRPNRFQVPPPGHRGCPAKPAPGGGEGLPPQHSRIPTAACSPVDGGTSPIPFADILVAHSSPAERLAHFQAHRKVKRLVNGKHSYHVNLDSRSQLTGSSLQPSNPRPSRRIPSPP